VNAVRALILSAWLCLPWGAAQAATQYLAVPGGRVAFDDSGGNGKLVIAVPGMGDVRAEYRYLTPVLAKAGARVVTLDVRGFGETDARWPDYSAHAVAGDVLTLIRHFHAGRAIVVGTSFAAGAALWAAHDAPDLVRGVVLIGPIVQDRAPSWGTRAMLAVAFASPWRVAFWADYWDSLFPLRPPPDQATYRAALVTNLRQPGRMAALHAMVTQSKADTAAIIDQVKVPALVVAGTADPDFDDATADCTSLARRLHAALILVPGAGHYPQAETPDVVAPRIAAFVAAH
jgi:pimeloyl-ACP methyl ester carboxylesterase